MKSFQNLMKLAFISGLSLSLFACGSSDEAPISAESAEVKAISIPTQKEDIQVLFADDIAEDISQSLPKEINLPLGLQATLDIEYLGAFRVTASGQSNSNYAVGSLGFNPDNHSIYMVGHDHHNAIAEFEIPSELSFETQARNIPTAPVLQKYYKVLGRKEVGNTNTRITGILYHNQNLLVSSEIWYDGKGNNRDNLQIFSNAYDLRSSVVKGMLQIEGAAKAAGYMFKVPAELTEKIGSEYLIGWASNYSITSRYSQGPSLYRFDPNQAIDAVLSVDRAINANPLMVFPLSQGKQLVEGGDGHSLNISPIWGPLAQVKYGFIIPGTTYFLAIGSHSGLHNGTGYKITQDNGNSCGGGCAYDNNDKYNYFWIFDVNNMIDADKPWLVRPISYGKWSHPYDEKGGNQVIGGTYNDKNNILYLALKNAGQTGEYDRPPLIISYQVKAKQ